MNEVPYDRPYELSHVSVQRQNGRRRRKQKPKLRDLAQSIRSIRVAPKQSLCSATTAVWWLRPELEKDAKPISSKPLKPDVTFETCPGHTSSKRLHRDNGITQCQNHDIYININHTACDMSYRYIVICNVQAINWTFVRLQSVICR